MDVVDQPAAAVRPHHVDRQHLTTARALELNAVGPELVPPRNEQRSFDDPVTRVNEVLLDDGEALAQDVDIHRAGRGPTLRSPQLAHAFLIVGLDRREKLGDRLVHRLRHWRLWPRTTPTRGAAGEQENTKRESSVHEATPVVRTTRR
jgi:hypothetical protein